MTSPTHPDRTDGTDDGSDQLHDARPEQAEGQSQPAAGEVDASSEAEGRADVPTANGLEPGNAAALNPSTVDPDGQDDGVGPEQIRRSETDVGRLATVWKQLKRVKAGGWSVIGIIVVSIATLIGVGEWRVSLLAGVPLLTAVITCIVSVVQVHSSQANAEAYMEMEIIKKHHNAIKQHHGDVKQHHGAVQERQDQIESHLKEIKKLRKKMTKHHTSVGDHHEAVKRHLSEVRKHHQEIEKHNREVGMHREYVFVNNLRLDLRTGLTELLAALKGIRERVKTEKETTESQLLGSVTGESIRDVDELKQRLDTWEATANVVGQATHRLQEALAEMLKHSMRGEVDVRSFLVNWDGTVNRFVNRVRSQL